MKGIIGTKIGMTQIFAEDGVVVPVTVVQAEPNFVVQVKDLETDGYQAVQIAGGKKVKKANNPQKGHFAKAGVEPRKVVREFRGDFEVEAGAEISVAMFEAGDKIDVIGTSKGKGTQGPIKRHNQSRGPMAHGSKYHRGAGSLGASSFPARVMKGMKGAGRMGAERVTVQNLEVVRVDVENNLILVKGAIPGPKRGTVVVQKAVKSAE